MTEAIHIIDEGIEAVETAKDEMVNLLVELRYTFQKLSESGACGAGIALGHIGQAIASAKTAINEATVWLARNGVENAELSRDGRVALADILRDNRPLFFPNGSISCFHNPDGGEMLFLRDNDGQSYITHSDYQYRILYKLVDNGEGLIVLEPDYATILTVDEVAFIEEKMGGHMYRRGVMPDGIKTF